MSAIASLVEKLFLSGLVHALYQSHQALNPERILVLRSSRLGDFICAMPALNRLRDAYPSAKILLLTLPSGSRLMRGKEGDASWLNLLPSGIVDEVVLFRRQDIFSARGFSELRRRVVSFDPNMTFIFPFVREAVMSRLKKILFLRGLGVRANLYGWRGRAIDQPTLKRGERYGHQVFGPLNALREQGIATDFEKGLSFDIAVDQEAKGEVEVLLRNAGLDGLPVVAIFPGGTFEHKRWPLRNFVSLCHRLLMKYPVRFIVVGGEGEEVLGISLAKVHSAYVHNWVGQTELTLTAEILRRSILFVGNDSGVAHLASAVGTPSVTIFSAIESPGTWEPWQSRELAVRTSVPCQYCQSMTLCPNGTLACTEEIPVSQVLEMCESVLSGYFCVNEEPCLESQ